MHLCARQQLSMAQPVLRLTGSRAGYLSAQPGRSAARRAHTYIPSTLACTKSEVKDMQLIWPGGYLSQPGSLYQDHGARTRAAVRSDKWQDHSSLLCSPYSVAACIALQAQQRVVSTFVLWKHLCLGEMGTSLPADSLGADRSAPPALSRLRPQRGSCLPHTRRSQHENSVSGTGGRAVNGAMTHQRTTSWIDARRQKHTTLPSLLVCDSSSAITKEMIMNLERANRGAGGRAQRCPWRTFLSTSVCESGAAD